MPPRKTGLCPRELGRRQLGLFSGDDESMKVQVARVIENARRVKAKTILYPE